MSSPTELGFLPIESCRVDRAVFRNPEQQAEFDRKGYVVMPLLSLGQVDQLVSGYDSIAESLGGRAGQRITTTPTPSSALSTRDQSSGDRLLI